jgi:mannose-6-phosphate isomerase-like protein (cupin superfamily)
MSKGETSQIPWGTTEVLTEGENYRVKRICIKVGHRQSYQSHKKRAESWVVVSGHGKITIDDKEDEVKTAAIIMIPVETKHRIQNISTSEDLVFIETQFGSYIGEDDIIRYEDDYGRDRANWTREDDAELYD